MNHDRSDVGVATRGGEASLGIDDELGATLQLWRAPNPIGPVFRPWLWSGPHPGSAGAAPNAGALQSVRVVLSVSSSTVEGGRHLAQADQGVPGLTGHL